MNHVNFYLSKLKTVDGYIKHKINDNKLVKGGRQKGLRKLSKVKSQKI